MQISNRILLGCVIVSFLSPAIVTAQDTDAQIKARQALDQKMKELQAREAAPDAVPTAPPPAAKPREAAPAPTAAPAAPAKPKSAGDTVIVEPTGATAGDTERQMKARQALDQKMRELDAGGTAPGAMSAGVIGADGFMELPPPSDPAASDKAMDALRAKMATLRPVPRPPSERVPEHPREKKMASSLPPLPTPPSAVSSSKEARLQDILQQYKADQLSPEQYHTQRAKILSEP